MLLLDYIYIVITLWVVNTAITQGHVFSGMRNLFRKMAFMMLPQCVSVHFILLLEKDNVITWTAPDEDEPAYSTVTGYDFISCGLCVGFWLSLAFVILSGQELADVGRYWGGSYLLTRLTR